MNEEIIIIEGLIDFLGDLKQSLKDKKDDKAWAKLEKMFAQKEAEIEKIKDPETKKAMQLALAKRRAQFNLAKSQRKNAVEKNLDRSINKIQSGIQNYQNNTQRNYLGSRVNYFPY